MKEENNIQNADDKLIEQLHKAENNLAEGAAFINRGEEELRTAEHEIERIEEELARESRIIVNGRERTIKGRTVSFEQAVRIAFPYGPSRPDIKYSVTYGNAVSPHRDGELDPGQKVIVKHGGNPHEETSFCVTETILS